MNVQESLTAKVGPLPAWAWGLGLGVSIVGVKWYLGRNKSSPVESVTSDGETASTGANTTGGGGTADGSTFDPYAAADGAVDGGSVGSYSIPSAYQNYGGVIDHTGTETGTPTGTGRPTTNDEWRAAAHDALRGKYGANAASLALSKFLLGDPLTATEEAMIDYAQAYIGEPPEGAPQITRAAPTNTSTPPAPTPATSAPGPAQVIPTPALPWIKPSWLNGVRFLKGDGPAVYSVTDKGLEWIPSEGAFTQLGGGGTIHPAGGQPYTYPNPSGTPPVLVSDAVIAGLPKVGQQP